MEKTPVPMPDPLVTTPMPNALVIDARPAEEFAAGHLQGAVHLDLWGVSLIDTSEAPLRAFMWMIGHLFSLRGVTPDRPVVVYDTTPACARRACSGCSSISATRPCGCSTAASRRGCAPGMPVTTEATAPTPGTWHGSPDASDCDLGCTSSIGSDSQDRDRRHSKRRPSTSARPFAPSAAAPFPARCISNGRTTSHPTAASSPPNDLRAMYEGAASRLTVRSITYCQGGYRAAHAYLALRRLGYPRVRNYTGSWKEWGDRDDLPLERPARKE